MDLYAPANRISTKNAGGIIDRLPLSPDLATCHFLIICEGKISVSWNPFLKMNIKKIVDGAKMTCL